MCLNVVNYHVRLAATEVGVKFPKDSKLRAETNGQDQVSIQFYAAMILKRCGN